jgi:hypothetical protein
MLYSPYHAGELEMQRKTGEEIPAYRNARIVAPSIAAGAVPYIESLPYVVVSSQDGQGRLWASILSGEAGYVTVVNPHTLRLDKRRVHANPADVFWQNLQSHPGVGMLFIDLATRRRYRVNGQAGGPSDQPLITVQQAYVNCPKYIGRRAVTLGPKPAYPAGIATGEALTGSLAAWIAAADAFFVGSGDGAGHLDASYRGGNPGFVAVLDPHTLRIPDYEGNSMYNTLGNFLVYARAGLLFLDFAGHRTLQLTGTARVAWEDDPTPDSGATGRSWTFTVEAWVLLENLTDAAWTFIDHSPFNPA